jgi:hypothetical protein
MSILLVAVLCTMAASVPSGALKTMELGEISGGGLAATAATPRTLELVSQMGGPTYAAVVEGNLLYFGVGPRLVIWDVSDPTAPVLLGQTGMLRDVVVDIDVAGGFAYLACERGGLRVVDVSDPAAPREVGSYQIDGLPTEAFAVDVVGYTAYVADRLRGLRVVDVSAPTDPQELGAFDTPGFAMDVAVVGQYAYVADESYGLGVIDVSVPENPTPVAVDSYTHFDVYGVTADGGRLYVATDEGLDVLSLADPTAPTLLGTTRRRNGRWTWRWRGRQRIWWRTAWRCSTPRPWRTSSGRVSFPPSRSRWAVRRRGDSRSSHAEPWPWGAVTRTWRTTGSACTWWT